MLSKFSSTCKQSSSSQRKLQLSAREADTHRDDLGCHRNTAKAAYGAVEIPEGVIDLLTGLRDYLQDKCEPPVYVSDRRFMKSIQMLQVAAFADGRDSVRAVSRRSTIGGLSSTVCRKRVFSCWCI